MRRKIVLIAGTVGLGLGVMLLLFSFLAFFMMPDTFVSTARISLTPNPAMISPAPASGQATGGFIQTEMERIQSSEILYPVITNLGLNKKWAARSRRESDLNTAESHLLLKGKLDIRQDRSPSLVTIRTWSEDKLEAVTIANEIARVYANERRQTTGGAVVQVIEAAEPALRPAKDWPTLIPLFGVALISLLGGTFLLIVGFVLMKPRPAT